MSAERVRARLPGALRVSFRRKNLHPSSPIQTEVMRARRRADSGIVRGRGVAHVSATTCVGSGSWDARAG
ncbi:hypothetical protein GOBAR_DD01515 [Gossypium barbadense]|nr:hypothetical protein GOBAR_DD01515 [Gossypium barbadense]